MFAESNRSNIFYSAKNSKYAQIPAKTGKEIIWINSEM